jgi:geranylgeranylglycerol-phosphate geranylgeranyltransferase
MSRDLGSTGASTRSLSAGIMSLVFWKSFWTTMRPYLIFISGAAGLVGMAFIEKTDFSRLIPAFIPLFLSYGLGQALTDCFQMDTDALSASYRPLIRGIISRKQVLGVSLAGLGLGVSILAILNPEILVPGVLAVAGLLSYTTLKRKWWGGPFWNSWIVALLPIMGRLVEKDVRLIQIFSFKNPALGGFGWAVLAVFFGYANFVLMGYFKDISADRATGYRTFPVVFGWRRAAFGSDLFALAAAVSTGLARAAVPHTPVLAIGVYVVALLVSLLAQVGIHRIKDEDRAHGPIAGVVRAFILYAAAIILCLKPDWTLGITIFYVGFEITLKLRPEERQV